MVFGSGVVLAALAFFWLGYRESQMLLVGVALRGSAECVPQAQGSSAGSVGQLRARGSRRT